MTKAWILIANSSEAHLYSSPKAKLLNGHPKLTLIEDFNHPESRKKSSELVSDRLGRTLHGSLGRAFHGAYMEPTDPQKVEAENFAIQLAQCLEHGRVNNEFDELLLFAPGHFQSLLKNHTSTPLQHMIERSVDRDYTHCSQKDLIGQIQQWL